MSNSARTELTAYQRDIWVAGAQDPEHPQFTVLVAERLDGPVDTARLLRCCRRALEGTDALCLQVADDGGTPVQWIDRAAVPVEVHPAPGDADAWIAAAAERAFVLGDGPLARVTLLTDGPQRCTLVVAAHHIVADTHALALFTDAVLALYAGTPPERPSPSYLDVVADDLAYRGSDRHARDRDALAGEIGDATPTLFGRDSGVPGGRARLVLDGPLVEAMIALGESPFSFVAATVASYLARMHQTDEVVLGVPLRNRRTHRERETVGQFANTLPLRLWTDGHSSLRTLAAEVRASTSVLREHQRLALGDLLSATAPDAGGPRVPFDVTVSYLRHPLPREVPGVRRTTTHRASAHRPDAVAIHMHAYEGRPGIEVDLHVTDGVLAGGLTPEAVADHLAALLHAGVQRPSTGVGELTMTSGAERERLAAFEHGPVVAHPVDHTVTGLIEACVDRDPDAPAVVGKEPLTRSELDRRANQVAHGLTARGVRRGDRVAVLVERGPELLPAIFGVLKAGAAYVPVDPGNPAERIAFVLADCAASVVLTGSPAPDGVPGAVPVTSLLHGPDSRPDPVAGPDDLAYVIYTSGTTGKPKGAMIEHRSVVNRLAWMQRAYPIGPGDVLLQKTPISFDVSVWELFWWAMHDAAVTLAPPGAQRDPEQLMAAIDEGGCTVAHFVPSLFEPFLSVAGDAPTSLRRIFCSGEALPPARVEQCARVLGPDVSLVNLYGPTEATVDVSYQDCRTEPGVLPESVPIGRPVDNTSLFVLDAHRNRQPVGVPGELYIAGAQLARGYLDRPELTAQRFVELGWAPGGRAYRTGDLARWNDDGTIEFLGRLDDQVKIRGNRVELGEVGDALRRLPGVRDAVVLDRTTAARGTHLVAYVVPDTGRDTEPDTEPDPAALRAGLAGSLPDYMIPALFVPIARVPLTVNGKTDRRALPAPDEPVARDRTAPRGPVQTALAAVWASVLGTGPVGVHDDYFALGGDSLLMLRVRADAAAAGVHFSLTDLLRHPTVAGLADVARHGEASGEAPLEPFALVSRIDRARLTHVDDAFPAPRLGLGMLFHSRRDPDGEHYRDVFRYSLDTPWSGEHFTAAFDALVARHPAMRSAFDLANLSEPLQLVHPSVPRGLRVTDQRGHDEAVAEAAIERHVTERRRYRYRSDEAPLYLFHAFVRDGSLELVVSFHHALFDGGSIANLLSELFRDYLAALGLAVDPVPDVAVPSPATHARTERSALDSDADRAYWAGLVADAPRTRIEPLAGAVAAAGPSHFSRDLPIDQETTAALRALAAEHAVPLKSVLLAAHCLVLGRLTGQDEVVTGLVSNGRPELRHAERMVGLFLNTVPLRADVGGDALDAVRSVLRAEREGHPHRRRPLSAIQQDRDGTPVFDTAFNFVHFHVLAPLYTVDGVRLRSFRTWERTEFALLVNVFTDPGDGRMHLRLDYDGGQFPPAQAELIEQTWTTVLHALGHRPRHPIGVAGAAPAAPRTAPAARPCETVTGWFTDRARDVPDAPAVVHANRTWSYARLERTARAVAYGLIDAGVRPGAAVGIAVPRSPELVATVLGVTMAGAACLPLDTSYPAARITAMLERAEPDAVVRAHGVGPTGAHDLALDELTATPLRDDELPRPSSEDPCYVLFTSGSTGEPKGVVQPHRTLANLVAWQNARPTGAVGGRTCQFAPLSFDVSFQEIFSTLCGGGTLVLVDDELRRDPSGLLRLLDREGVDRVYLPYVALEQLADASSLLGIVPRALRVIVSSGEQLRISDSVRALCAALPDPVLENQYGPTETHVATAYPLTGDPSGWPALPPIGRPIDGTDVVVRDAQGRPAPAGTRGEIVIGGACLADGYVGRADLTAERFTEHPERPGERLYRTGDAGVALPDGTVVCLGRLDGQVKVRGYRVEPAEVELVLRRVAGRTVRDAAVVTVRGDGADARLVAFLVAADGGPTTGTDGLDGVRHALRAELPEYLVPGHLQWVEAIPTTPSGKRDDTALRAVGLTGTGRSAPVAPRDDHERVLLGMVGELLHDPGMGVHDDLFAAGATSLTAMRLTVQVEQRFGVAVPLSALAAGPTVADLATHLRDGSARSGYDPLVPLRKDGQGPPLFLVHPMGGNVLCYLPLVRHLAPGHPVYGLAAPGTEPGSEPIDSVERLADAYLEAVRRVQPSGPYLLGGWSFGGFVAFEMARRLRERGEEVAELVLIDSIAPGAGDRGGAADSDALLRWFFWELLWLEHGSTAHVGDLPDGASDEERFAHVAALAVDAGVLPPGSTGALVRRLFTMFAAHWTALHDYRPEPADLDVTLVHASGPLPPVLAGLHDSLDTQHADPANGWGGWTRGRLDVVDVSGDHLELMEEPHVRTVADVVAGLVRRSTLAVTR